MAPNQKRFVLKLANYCECDGCHRTLKKLLEIDGVHSTLIDAKTGELTVSGPVDPQKVIKFLEKNGKNAKLVTEEIQLKRTNHGNAQIIMPPVASMPQPVVVQEFKGLKQLEVTHSKNVKVTFNGKNIDEVSTQSDTWSWMMIVTVDVVLELLLAALISSRRPHGKETIFHHRSYDWWPDMSHRRLRCPNKFGSLGKSKQLQDVVHICWK